MTIKEPRRAFEPPEQSHCPDCNGCDDVVGHCEKEGLCLTWGNIDFVAADCSCQCRECRASRAGVPTCDDKAEHETCERHREPRDEYDPDDQRFTRRQS